MKKLFFGLVFLILCFNLVSAFNINTTIQIKTVPYTNVNVLVLSPEFDLYERFNADSDGYGDVSFVFSSNKSKFGVSVFVKDLFDNSKVASAELENQAAGKDIYLEVVPEGFKVLETPAEENISIVENLTDSTENATLNETNSLITIEEKQEKKFNLSGFAIFGENSKLKKIIFYVLGGIVLALIIFFVIRKIKREKTGEIRVKKLSELREEQREEQKGTPGEYYGILDETQRKLEETQRELNQLKNQDRIKETERKLQQDQEELRKLRGF